MTDQPYIRIEPHGAEVIGVPHVVNYDRLVFVDGDVEVDISGAVSGYTILSKVGEARLVTLELLRVEVVAMSHEPREYA